MPPKKPFKLPKFPKQQTTSTIPTPTTPQDLFDSAVDHEEQGDRWLISDLSKSLRAYQKAFEYYRQVLSGLKTRSEVSSDKDSCYNYLRLIYHVHDTYKNVPSVALSGVEGCNIHGMSLMDVKNEYTAIVDGQFDGWLNWECAYNEVLINTEIVEEGDIDGAEMMRFAEKSVRITQRLVEFQVGELDLFVKRLEGGDESVDEEKKVDGGEEEFQMYEQITPSSVLESVIAGFKLVLASFEFCDDREQIGVLNQGLNSFIDETLISTSKLILVNFDPRLNIEDKYQLNVSPEAILELELIQQCIHALLLSNYTELSSFWDNYTIDTSSVRYLAEADSFENFRNLGEYNSEEIWTILTKENQCLKTAQELIQKELEENRAKKTTDVSVKVCKIVQVLINRADNELIRSQLQGYEPAVKNSEVLKQNAINLLKSGMNVAQANVGLRERISDKLSREKVRRECIVRLVLLTKDHPTQEDFVRNLGAGFWEKEVADVRGVDLYRHALE